MVSISVNAQQPIVVDLNGKGDFTSIQSAINSLIESSEKERVIQIKNGVYNEKIFIEKNNIVLEGENRDKVIITQSIARDEFRCSHKDDWGAATVNVNGNDVTFKNLTIKNSFGFDFKEEYTIPCESDSSHIKTIRKSGHQMALRSMKATRLKAINCYCSSFGGDTVSPWNVENGLF
jgi:pectinesterase